MERTILVLDDELAIRVALERALRGEGYTVLLADTADEALRLLHEHEVQVILSDHMMPEMTGLEFLRLMRDRFPAATRIMLTGHADVDTTIAAINDAETYRFLTKPWDDLELRTVVYLAFQHAELERANRQLITLVRREMEIVAKLEEQHPRISSVVRDARGAVVLSDEELRDLGVN